MEQTLDREAQRKEIKGLCELSSRWNAVFIALEWLSIFLVVYCNQKFFNPVTYFLSVVWIGSRLHALGILMHEAAHYRLFNNRKLAEIVGEAFLAWPITMTLRGYRNTHLAHHQYLNTAKDPDWDMSDKYFQFPKSKIQMLHALMENAFGIAFYREVTRTPQSEDSYGIPRSLRVCQLTFFAAIVVCSIFFSFWKLLLLYWLVPAITSLLLINYMRSIAEHYGLDYSNELNSSRNSIGTFWEQILIAPYNVGFHLDHHLHQGVPWYNLGKLHAVLMRDSDYKSDAHITESYCRGVLRECTQPQRVVD